MDKRQPTRAQPERKPEPDATDWIEPISDSMERVADAMFRQAKCKREQAWNHTKKAT